MYFCLKLDKPTKKMYIMGMTEDFISKKEKEIAQASAEFQKMHHRDSVISAISIIIAPLIFFGLKYVYSLLH
jgi:hypothetical protein